MQSDRIRTQDFTATSPCTATALSPHVASSRTKVVADVVVVVLFFVARTHLRDWPGMGSLEGLMCALHKIKKRWNVDVKVPQ